MAKHNELGTWGEQQAVAFLLSQGYIVRELDWHHGHRDIDIIVVTPDLSTVVFVEVKTRTSDQLARPEEAVDTKKIRNLGLAANAYVKEHDVAEELRFDLITVIGDERSKPRIEHVEDAFNPCML